MKKLIFFTLACAFAAEAPMGSTTDWFAFGGDGLRDGWEKNEQRFSKDEVKDFRFLWKHAIGNAKRGVGRVFPPVVLGRLIGYRGFKELAFVAGSANGLWSIDADLDRRYWEKHFGAGDSKEKGKAKHACGGDLTAVPALPGPVVFHAAAAGRRRSSAYSFGQARPVYVLTGDGLLRQLNQADGEETGAARQFVPAGVAATALNVSEDVLYTSTDEGCGNDAAVWSLDAADPEAKAKSVKLGSAVAGMSGVVLDSEGRAFVQTKDGLLDAMNEKYGSCIVELDKDLTVSRYFILPDGQEKKSSTTGMNETSPVVFTFNGTELVVSANKDGRLYVLKAADIGASDHHHYVSRSVVVPAMDDEKGHGIWGGLASWEDADGSRYVLTPVWGPLSTEVQAAVPKTKAPNGSIVVFKVEEDKIGAAQLKPVWVTRDLDSPTPPVIAKGVVFALSNGRFSSLHKGAVPRGRTHATLFAFDGVTGKEMYSTGDQVTAAGNLTGLTIANGRVYFVTVDNTLEVFGKYLEP